MSDTDYLINLAILFASLDGLKGPLIPCTKSRDSSNMMRLKSRPYKKCLILNMRIHLICSLRPCTFV